MSIYNVTETTYSLSVNLGNSVLPPVKMMLETAQQCKLTCIAYSKIKTSADVNDTSQKAQVEDMDGKLVQHELYTQQVQLDLCL